MPQTQEEFYFGHPVRAHGPPASGDETTTSSRRARGRASASTPDDVEIAYREIERRRVATEYLHAPPIVVEPAG